MREGLVITFSGGDARWEKREGVCGGRDGGGWGNVLFISSLSHVSRIHQRRKHWGRREVIGTRDAAQT